MTAPGPAAGAAGDWFDDPAAAEERGLRFQCTMCGNCCTGPEGYVLYTEEDAQAIAAHLGVSVAEFTERYTRMTVLGRSLAEKPSPFGLDCTFLDRETIPGRAVCSVYEARPGQCRTWPFWPRLLRSRETWLAAGRTCPGIGLGPLIAPEEIRVLRGGAGN